MSGLRNILFHRNNSSKVFAISSSPLSLVVIFFVFLVFRATKSIPNYITLARLASYATPPPAKDEEHHIQHNVGLQDRIFYTTMSYYGSTGGGGSRGGYGGGGGGYGGGGYGG
ncbi:hypothetical protein THAOC_14275, partial [Thalassiosira oceanica]